MKLRLFKCLPLAVAGLFIGGAVQAQDSTRVTSGDANRLNTWSIGINGGALAPISPLGEKMISRTGKVISVTDYTLKSKLHHISHCV
ncbi:hypothetical protein [Pedobacter steynii]